MRLFTILYTFLLFFIILEEVNPEVQVTGSEFDPILKSMHLDDAQCSLDKSAESKKCMELNDNNNENDNSNGRVEKRKKRQTEELPLFVPTADPLDFWDVDLTGELKLYNLQRPKGYANKDRLRLLLFDPKDHEYPPFSYRGFYNPKLWHKIPIKSLIRKANRSFMLLQDTCEVQEKNREGYKFTSELDLFRLTKECEKAKYDDMFPVCRSDTQSPINIITANAVTGSLPDYFFSNTNDEPVALIMSLPWDGTNLLTVELLEAVQNPDLSFEGVDAGVGEGVENGTKNIPRTPQISLGALSGENLYLDRIHIKYGTNVGEGSEHRIDGKPFSMELQFIFKGRTKGLTNYWDILQADYVALHSSSGQQTADLKKYVHILSVLVNVETDPQKYKRINDTWNKKAAEALGVLSNLGKQFWSVSNRLMNDKGEKKKFRAYKTNLEILNSTKNRIYLQDILPPLAKNTDDGAAKNVHSQYYTYTGGITHPPCFGNVDWAIYIKPITISMDIWKHFLYIPSEFDDSGFVAGNFRNVGSIYVADLDLKHKSMEEVKRAEEKYRARRVELSKPADDTQSTDDYYEDYDAGFKIQLYTPIIFSICIYECIKLLF